jgi:hypothetical protein
MPIPIDGFTLSILYASFEHYGDRGLCCSDMSQLQATWVRWHETLVPSTLSSSLPGRSLYNPVGFSDLIHQRS